MSLSAQVDPGSAECIVFSEPITIQQAITYLWTRPPTRADAIRPDPSQNQNGRPQRRYLINTNDLDLVLSLQHGLADAYARRLRPIASQAPVEIPQWVPSHIRNEILNGQVTNGAHRYQGQRPWGDIVVWINRSGGLTSVAIYQDFPPGLEYYFSLTGGNQYEARLLHEVYTQFNKDMSHFVEKRGFSPGNARLEIQRINDELFKLVISASIEILSSGVGISAINSELRASSRRVISAAERSGFARLRGIRRMPNQIRESTGASLRGSTFQSASARTARSTNTAIRADIAESEAYKAALLRGEIGLQRPQGSNVIGSDFITAGSNSQGLMEILVSDVKMSTIGRFPTASTTIPPAWLAEVRDAIAPNRLNLNDRFLEQEIRDAFAAGRVRPRQLNADYSPAGQGSIRGF